MWVSVIKLVFIESYYWYCKLGMLESVDVICLRFIIVDYDYLWLVDYYLFMVDLWSGNVIISKNIFIIIKGNNFIL